MGKGRRNREKRQEERDRTAEAARVAREAAERRAAFFAAFDPEDTEAGPALPCPECGSFDRRWADEAEARAAIAAFDAQAGLPPGDGRDERRRVGVCRACGSASVVPDLS